MVKDKIIFIDSDGTVMDSMTLKHTSCFGPAIIETYNLEDYKEDILNRWNIINLYSLTRGINRFDGHYIILSYINSKYKDIPFLGEYKEWLDNTKAKSNQELAKYIETYPSLKPILDWSILTNNLISKHQEEVKPFNNVENILKELHKNFIIVVISSANNKAVMNEWEKFDILKYTDEVCTQEMGTKETCIEDILNKIKPTSAIMLGDAVSDLYAAQTNSINFYPIIPLEENKSWQDFLTIYSEKFYHNQYNEIENKLIESFYKKLKKEN